MTRRTRAALVVFLAAAVFFSVGAASRGPWHNDEHRIAEVARAMAAPGGDLLVPHLNGEVYAHKPPLVPWIVALCHGALGMDLALAAKVPSILGAALAVLATYLIGRRLYGPAAGVASAVVLATAAEFAWIGRRTQYDPLLTGFTTLAMWSFVRSHFAGESAERPRPWRDAVVGFLCLGLAAMTKGPVAFVFSAPVVTAFALLIRYRDFVSPRLLAGLLVLVPAGIWLAAAAAREGTHYVVDLVFGHGIGHAVGDDTKEEWIGYYLLALPRGFVPWIAFAPAAVIAATRRARSEERRADVFVLAWFAVPFVVMSCFPAKRDLYLLPLFPAAGLCVGRLAELDEERLRGAAFAVARFGLAALLLAGGLAVFGLCVLAALGEEPAWLRSDPVWNAVRNAPGAGVRIAAVIAAAVVLVVLAKQAFARRSAREAFARLMSAAVVIWLVVAGVVLPALDPVTSPRAFYRTAAGIVGDAPIARWGVDDFAAHWTMRRDVIPYVYTRRAAERFLAGADGPAYLVVEDDRLGREGRPAGTTVVLHRPFPAAKDLVLLGKSR